MNVMRLEPCDANSMLRPRILVAFALLLAAGCSFEPPPDVGDDDDDDTPMHDGAPVDCEPNAVICAGDELVTCSPEGEEVSREPCALGCHDSGERCNDLDPSNGLAEHLDDAASAPDVVLEAGATINTDDSTITGTTLAVPTTIVTATPVEILVIEVGSLSAQDVRVTGSRALAIVSDSDITLNGPFDISASYMFGGPGSIATGADCSAQDGVDAGSTSLNGGGGGGFGGAGGNGGTTGFSGGIGGAAAGNATLVPLRGGCPGAWYEGGSGPPATSAVASSPGGGGGVVQMVSRTRVVVADGGAIVANGGSAKGYTGPPPIPACILGNPCGPGAGGGSGGGVLLEAPAIEIAGAGIVAANGGGGHCGLGSETAPPTATTTPAPGRQCTAFAGGNGAAGDTAATNGTVEADSGPTGGGGGGGGGRVRVNVPAGTTFSPSATAVLSPAPTVGALATR
jgi:hypothetical protein